MARTVTFPFLLLAVCATIHAAEPPALARPSLADGAEERFQRLLNEERSFAAGIIEALRESNSLDDHRRLHPMIAKKWREFGTKALTIAKEHPEDPSAAHALLHHFQGPLPYTTTAEEAAQLLLDRYATSEFPKIVGPQFIFNLRAQQCPAAEKLLRGLSERELEGLRGPATYALAYLLHRKADAAASAAAFRTLGVDDGHEASDQGGISADLLGFDGAAWLADLDIEQARREAAALYLRVTTHHASVPFLTGTLGDAARAGLAALRSSAIGSVAPKTAGCSVKGDEIKLEDYRGKVVVLAFSAQWCGPCKALYPQYRRILSEHAGRPFAVIGVSGDASREPLEQAIQDGDITWPCIYGGGDGAVVKLWHVDAWPTVIVIDHQGTIRDRRLGSPSLPLIEKLVSRAEQDRSESR